MQSLSGEEFDRAYLREAGVKEHEKAERLFRNQSTRGKDAELVTFAAKVLPAVQGHLTQVKGLESSVSGSSTALLRERHQQVRARPADLALELQQEHPADKAAKLTRVVLLPQRPQ
ncbi:MAG: DUF4142 domain-containing protein [Pyrinomonadaceae bacterium]